MYSVLDIARYIINYCNDKKMSITHLKLQKILYFVQANFLINGHDEGCFKEDIEAWDFGPVVREVYNEFKCYGNSNIPEIEKYIDFSNGIWNAEMISVNSEIIKESDKELIDDIVNQCKNFTASELVEITHSQTPWVDTFNEGEGRNEVISRESIKEFFEED